MKSPVMRGQAVERDASSSPSSVIASVHGQIFGLSISNCNAYARNTASRDATPPPGYRLRTSLKLTMSVEAIISDIAQDNAIELETLRKLECIETLASGLIDESLNRTDALSELEEKLQRVRLLISI
jgi:hypothetical protein